MKIKITLIILNLAAVILILPVVKFVHYAQIRMATNMYVELDRSQVINQKQLEKAFPNQTGDYRYGIPRLFMARHNPALLIGYPCIIIFISNAILVAVFFKSHK